MSFTGLALWLACAPLPAAAEDPLQPGLNWVRLPGAESCLSASALATRVETRVGRMLFVSVADAGLSVDGSVRALASGGLPDGGFDPREASVEVPSASCATGVCLIYQLEGDPSSDCAPPSSCSTAETVAHSVYCSCRCDAAGGPAPECECPDGFSCVEVLSSGPETVTGGYCVRND